MAKVTATQIDLTFQKEGPGVSIINLPKALSEINRKMFRSGYVYGITGFTVSGVAGDICFLSKIPEGYVAEQSWKHVFDQWRKQRAETLDTSSGVTGKWSDFKVYFNERHFDGTYAELLPQVFTAGALTSVVTTGGEWNYSEMVYMSAGASVVLPIGMLGDDNTPVYGSVIEAWGDTRRTVLPIDPNVPGTLSTSWLEHMGPGPEDLEEDVENLIEAEGDQPPYAITESPANPIYLGGAAGGSDGIPHALLEIPQTAAPLFIDGGVFPLGMILWMNGGDQSLTVHTARGEYKGVAARRMGDSR